ncbi:MAG: phytanoyl-CoA dioxygenase [Rhodospirillaceae bacterium]|nr:phytanoyl-CoA dioxygenase [Rhodospirillaceae bacterium]
MSLDEKILSAFRRDGATVLRGVFDEHWIDTLRRGVEVNMNTPGEYTRAYTQDGAPGHFFGDYCNWQRIEEYRAFLFNSPAPGLARQLMRSQKVNLFHEHVLVKEPGTLDRTPWHHDQPYYCVNGRDTCSLWIPLDPVACESCVEFIAGSHLWERWFTPMKFIGEQYDQIDEGFEPIPDIDSERSTHQMLSWNLEPGDCIAFHFLTVHGAPGNNSPNRRRAFAARYVGDDAVFIRRAGIMSPPFPDITLQPGDPLDCETFPVISLE